MDYIAWCLVEAEEFFFELLTEKVEATNVLKLCEVMELQGTYENTYAPTSFEKLVLLHGSMEKNYTLDEITYLQCSCNDAVLCTCSETGHVIIFSEIDFHEEDKILVASAITKITIKAFGDNVLLCFRHGSELAFGAACESHDLRSDYCLSRWYSTMDILQLVEMCNNCNGDLEEIALEILRSAQSRYERKSYDTAKYDYEYIPELQYIAATYGIDLSNEIDRYSNLFVPSITEISSVSDVRAINDMLQYIGVSEISSYDYLEKAVHAETIGVQRVQHFDEGEIEPEAVARITAIPPEALRDAEKMVRYFESERKVNVI